MDRETIVEGDLFTYRIASQYGDFGFIEKSDRKNILLYYKLQNQNQYKSDYDLVIIIPNHFVGFEEIPAKQQWKSAMHFYDKPFDVTFKANERNVASSLLFELDGDRTVLEKMKSLNEWRSVYEEVKHISFLEDEYCRIKTNYYRSDLPLLERHFSNENMMCDKCVGFGVIPIHFGINVKTGRCFKCRGSGQQAESTSS
jgi:hypothetical protein